MWSNRGEEVLQAIANMVGGKVTWVLSKVFIILYWLVLY
jgi:uncharacterized membrane protein